MNILLGISGSIAAYKAAHLTRLFVKAGAEVRILMTEAATHFISPLTLATLSKHPVVTSVHSEEGWNNHVELGLWADAYVIAPATANTLARLANGICDNALVAVYLSARCPVLFAPAMDLDMWAHRSTQANVARLQSYGNTLIDVADGELASGLSGKGRLAEPEVIFAHTLAVVQSVATTTGADAGGEGGRQDLAGKRVLITAGPTYEDLDPVRYLGNRSTGRMGIELARAARKRGASVELVLGPTSLEPPPTRDRAPELRVHHVRSAQDMYAAATSLWPHCDLAILAAAVADYRPATVAPQKIKKGEGPLRLELVRNPDIAADLGRTKRPHQRLVGFALETDPQQALANARAKLDRKQLDLIVLNSPSESGGTGFGHATNQVTLVDRNNARQFELKTKAEVACDILDAAVALRPGTATTAADQRSSP